MRSSNHLETPKEFWERRARELAAKPKKASKPKPVSLPGETPAETWARHAGGGKRPSKYRNVRTGHYDSKAEARYAATLAGRRDAGAILGWLEQVPLRFADGTVYRCDFVVVDCFGRIRFVEVKGKWTQAARIKMSLLRSEYPWVYERLDVIGAKKP